MAKRALFLDRDGVINIATPRGVKVLSPEDFKLAEGIGRLIKAARRKKYTTIVITNQAIIAEGEIKLEQLESIHNKMHKLLPGMIDKVYICPHNDKDDCDCRKPKPGMLLLAAKDLGLDLGQSIFVGDSDKDVKASRAAGVMKTVFVKNDYNAGELDNCQPDEVVDKLVEIIPLL